MLNCTKVNQVAKTGFRYLPISKKQNINIGAIKRGRGMCGTFKAFSLTYLHVVRAGMVLTPIS